MGTITAIILVSASALDASAYDVEVCPFPIDRNMECCILEFPFQVSFPITCSEYREAQYWQNEQLVSSIAVEDIPARCRSPDLQTLNKR